MTRWVERLIPVLLVAGMSTVFWMPQGAPGAGEPGPGPTPTPTPGPCEVPNTNSGSQCTPSPTPTATPCPSPICSGVDWSEFDDPSSGGIIVCCNGEKTKCINPALPPPFPSVEPSPTPLPHPVPDDTARRIKSTCLNRHEDFHISDPTVKCPKDGGYHAKPPEWDNRDPRGVLDFDKFDCEYHTAESCAHKVDSECLKEQEYMCNKDPDCEQDVREDIKKKEEDHAYHKKKAAEACGKANMCFPPCKDPRTGQPWPENPANMNNINSFGTNSLTQATTSGCNTPTPSPTPEPSATPLPPKDP
jgi:hypothetical protein